MQPARQTRTAAFFLQWPLGGTSGKDEEATRSVAGCRNNLRGHLYALSQNASEYSSSLLA